MDSNQNRILQTLSFSSHPSLHQKIIICNHSFPSQVSFFLEWFLVSNNFITNQPENNTTQISKFWPHKIQILFTKVSKVLPFNVGFWFHFSDNFITSLGISNPARNYRSMCKYFGGRGSLYDQSVGECSCFFNLPSSLQNPLFPVGVLQTLLRRVSRVSNAYVGSAPRSSQRGARSLPQEGKIAPRTSTCKCSSSPQSFYLFRKLIGVDKCGAVEI